MTTFRSTPGFRPAIEPVGPNGIPASAPPGTPRTYDSDSLTSYEIGMKSEWRESGVSLDIAAYYLDWKDIQLFAVINDTGVNANGGKAISKGLEFTAGFRPVTGLSLQLNGSYTDAFLTDDTDPIVGGLDGDPLPFVPDWSLSLSADYEWPVADGIGYVGTTLSYTDERTPEFGERDAITGELIELPSYKTVNLRAGMDMGRWSFEAYVHNLNDARRHHGRIWLRWGHFCERCGRHGDHPAEHGWLDGRHALLSTMAKNNLAAAAPDRESSGLELPQPYLLFLGDVTEPGLCEDCFRPSRLGARSVHRGIVVLAECDLGRACRSSRRREARAKGARSLVIGVANVGGRIVDSWLPSLLAALEAGLDIVSGMHESAGGACLH